MIEYIPFVLSLAWTVIWWRIVQRARQTTGWGTISGTIVDSGMKPAFADETGLPQGSIGKWAMRSHSRNTTYSIVSYEVWVNYSYAVGNVTYQGSKISSGQSWTYTLEPAQEMLATYPKGKEVTVYFDPMDPKKAVLEKGNSITNFIWLGVGVALSVITLIGSQRGWFQINPANWNVSYR